jgi:hypothetical protein
MSINFCGQNHNETETLSNGYKLHARVDLHDDPEADDSDPRNFNLSNMNGRAFLDFLGLESEDGPCGEASIADMRRAIFRAVNTFDRAIKPFTRETVTEYGTHRVNDDGTVELRPIRVVEFGIDESYFAQRLAQLATLVEALAARGATHITWG